MLPRFSLLNIRPFFSVAAIFIAIASYGQSNVVPDNVELAALRNIYDSLVGSGWTTKTNWPTAATWPASATSSQFGTWYGVTVSNGDINKISLAANNVTGQLPRSIGSLTKLKYLYLENNSITGSIPDTYGNFTGMLNFHLNNNQLTGSIPSSLGNLSTATHLRLQSNSLTGSIPASIGNLTQLTDFMVNSNQLSGPIPGTLGNLVNVEYFYLYGNQLTGAIPSSLGGLNSVHYFNINTNQLTGGIPSSFSNLDEMILFDVSTNQLSGEFPGVINGWLNMTQLKLNNNQFTGDFPAAISGCQALTLIAGQNNQFTSLPTALLSLPLVVTLSFYGNELTTIPDLSTHSNKTNLTLQVQNNRLDFNMLQLVYQKGIKTVSYDPQKALNDLLYLRVSPGGKLVIQSRGAGTGGTYSWERKLEGSSSFVNVNALNEDASAKTFTKSNFQNTDDGQFRYKMTNSLFPSSFSISSAAIAVRVSEFEAVWNSETGVKDVKGIISKTAAVGWGNAGALSENSLPANTDGWFEFTTNASSNYLLGFSLASNVSTALDGVEYGLEVSTTNQKIYAHESSVTGIDLGSWVSGDYFKIARIGSTLKYYKNGSEIRSVTVLPNKEYVLKAAINSGTVPAINNSFWLSTSRGAVPDAWEYMALKDFYDSLGGAGWNNKANWPTSPIGGIATTAAIMDSWNGITTLGGDITRIDLLANHLVGVIPSSISRLKKLNTLRVQNNLITGKIPEALSQLSEMSFLNLAINGISGTIPESLGNLSNLTWLGLYQLPSLSGPLPASLFILPKLENFYIYYTNVSGSIPSVINLPKIKVMYLYRNKLTGSLPESLAAQTTLTNLAIEGNPSMSGPLPATIGSLVNLTELWFNESGFSGTIPSSIGSLTKLQVLNLNDNQLEGAIPSSISNLVNLEWVALSRNDLSGTIPDAFGQMNKLDTIWLNHNQLTGTIPASMQNLSSLARLSLNSNQLSGEVPQWIGALTKLKTVNLDSNRFTAIGAINYPALTLVKQFTLNNNLLDFIQLTPLKNLNSKFTLFPQNEMPADTVKFLCSIEIQSRAVASTTSITWRKLTGTDWTDISASNQNPTQLLYRNSAATAQDEGKYMWSMADTGFPGKVIESVPIIVKNSNLVLEVPEFLKTTGTYCGLDTLHLSSSQQNVNYQLRRNNTDVLNSMKSGTGSTLSWTGLDPSGTYTVLAKEGVCNEVILPTSIDLQCGFQNVVVSNSVLVSPIATQSSLQNYKLIVGGDILSSGLNIKVPSKWPDYVFEDNYDLLSVTDLENFITKNGHLPNLPSAAQMEQKQIYSTADMDTKLLEKIEELTLYVLELDEQLNDQKNNKLTTSSKNASIVSEQKKLNDYELSFLPKFKGIKRSESINVKNMKWKKHFSFSGNGDAPFKADITPSYGDVNVSGTLSIAPYKSVPQNYKLVVGGNVISAGLDIKSASNWPDYVFTESYTLPTLEQLNKYIKENHHLPNLMSAGEMIRNENYSLAEMDAKLLEKVEELALYVIQLKKEIQSLQGNHYSSNRVKRKVKLKIFKFAKTTKNYSIEILKTSPFNSKDETQAVQAYNLNESTLNEVSLNTESVTITNSLCIACTGSVPEKYKLAIGGTILATGMDIKVPQKWPDYVFSNNYQLLSLVKVKKFIERNGHLPNMASGDTMIRNKNYDVATMDAKLLEKIEELTLYLINLKSQLEKLNGFH